MELAPDLIWREQSSGGKKGGAPSPQRTYPEDGLTEKTQLAVLYVVLALHKCGKI